MSIGFTHPLVSAGFDVPPTSVRRFTVDEYEHLGRTGVLTEDDSVELLEGLIVKKMTKNPLHDATIDLLAQVFARQIPAGWFVRIQNVLRTADSEPEPDVVIAIGGPADYLQRHPGPADVVLVIEVAESSLEQDWRKCRIYAHAGVAQYWIVDLNAFRVEVFTEPNRASGSYERHVCMAPPREIAVSLADGKVLRVALSEILPLSGA